MDKKYWIALSAIEQLSPCFFKALIEYFGDAEKAFNASLEDFKNIDTTLKKVSNFLEKRDKINPDKTFEEVISRGIKFLTYYDEAYPSILREISDPPMVLYYKGDLSRCNFERTVAFVGSRHCSINGKEATKQVIKGFAGTDVCIVSGLATGIDSVAHNAAIENNIKTIGVIASGFDFIYPTTNRKLYKQIEDESGVIFTEYFPTFEPIKFRFPQRNRIVSGLSYGTVVAEAAIKSGALITANLTLEQGRELMCIPGLINNPNTEGIYKLLKNGASIVTNAQDVLNALNWEIQSSTKPVQNNDFDNLTVDEKKILYTINIEPKTFDEIQKETQIDTETLLELLTTLELNSIITQTADNRYRKE